jgi:ABC-2 type transport system ATP-binding protein
MCERIVIIDHGRVIAGGTLDALVAATVGPQRHIVLTLDRVPPPLAAGDAEVDPTRGTYSVRVDDVAAELPALLARVAAAGARVEDVRVDRPSLQAVFLHLTGRELRE